MLNRTNIVAGLALLLLAAFTSAVIFIAVDDSVAPAPTARVDPLQALERAVDLANGARSRGEWEALRGAVLPGLHESCSPAQLAAVFGGEASTLQAVAEERLISSGAVLADPPRTSGESTSIELDREGALVERTLFAFGAAIDPTITASERWVEADGAWWLEVAGLAVACERVVVSADVPSGTDSPRYGHGFRNPARVGEALEADEGGSALRLTLLRAVRGGELPIPASPPPAGFENVFVELRVETTDDSLLKAPIEFRPASSDGLYYQPALPRGLRSCLEVDVRRLGCQVFQAVVHVAATDAAPRLAWLTSAPQDAPEAKLWWRLPGLDKGRE